MVDEQGAKYSGNREKRQKHEGLLSFKVGRSKVGVRISEPKAGPRPYDSLSMFTILILQSLYPISDDPAEF